MHDVMVVGAEQDPVLDRDRSSISIPPADVVHLAVRRGDVAPVPCALAIPDDHGSALLAGVEPLGPAQVQRHALRGHDDPTHLAVAQHPRELRHRERRAVLERRGLDGVPSVGVPGLTALLRGMELGERLGGDQHRHGRSVRDPRDPRVRGVLRRVGEQLPALGGAARPDPGGAGGRPLGQRDEGVGVRLGLGALVVGRLADRVDRGPQHLGRQVVEPPLEERPVRLTRQHEEALASLGLDGALHRRGVERRDEPAPRWRRTPAPTGLTPRRTSPGAPRSAPPVPRRARPASPRTPRARRRAPRRGRGR